ncbi:MAG: hypothetical protein M1818_007307 [Claussenomyces sp. TS43310]|nr:MAG: hypothetical protein M1818_007307 [Claussenomyces sp. TS43310]
MPGIWETYDSMLQKASDSVRKVDADVKALEEKIREVSVKRTNDITLDGLRLTLDKLVKKMKHLEMKEKEAQGLMKYFQQSCSIHPNQLLSKEYVKSPYTNKDTGLMFHGTLMIVLERAKARNLTGLDPVNFLRKGFWLKIDLAKPGVAFALKEALKTWHETPSFVKITARLQAMDQKATTEERDARTLLTSSPFRLFKENTPKIIAKESQPRDHADSGQTIGMSAIPTEASQNDIAVVKTPPKTSTQMAPVKNHGHKSSLVDLNLTSTATSSSALTSAKHALSDVDVSSSEVLENKSRYKLYTPSKRSKTSPGKAFHTGTLRSPIKNATVSQPPNNSPVGSATKQHAGPRNARDTFEARRYSPELNPELHHKFVLVEIQAPGLVWRRDPDLIYLEWLPNFLVFDPCIDGKTIYRDHPYLVVEPKKVRSISRITGSRRLDIISEGSSTRGVPDTVAFTFVAMSTCEHFIDFLLILNSSIKKLC